MNNTKDVRETIGTLLVSTGRKNIDKLLGYLECDDFFESPASTRFHGCYTGGLAKHSLGVYKILCQYYKGFDASHNFGAITMPVTTENLIIAGLLHDVCKIGAYLGVEAPYKWNRAQPKGHALLSLIRIAGYIELQPIEELMIRYHMGPYGLFEFEPGKGEYPLRGEKGKSKEERYGKSLANAWYHNPIVKLMYFCDELEMYTT
jgi:hypothetical protein